MRLLPLNFLYSTGAARCSAVVNSSEEINAGFSSHPLQLSFTVTSRTFSAVIFFNAPLFRRTNDVFHFPSFKRHYLPCVLAVSKGVWRGWRLSRRFSSGVRFSAMDTEMWSSATWAHRSEMDWPSALSSTSSDRT